MRAIFIRAVAVIALATSGAAPVRAQTSAPEGCPALLAPSGELAPWTSPQPLSGAADVVGAAELAVGQAADLALHPATHIAFPAKPGRDGGNGGLVAVNVAQAGTYRVALGAPAWIDVVRDGKALASTAHGHGEACTGIRKVVNFTLKPGRYVLAISGSPEERARVLVVRKP